MIIKRILFLILMQFLFATSVFANSSSDAGIILFYSESCPHCHEEMRFLKEIQSRYPELKISYFEVSKNAENLSLFKKVQERMGIKENGVPLTIIGGEYIVGFQSEQTTGKEIKSKVEKYLSGTDEVKKENKEENIAINVPLLGEVNYRDISLPLLTVLIGGLDGFNPCAMWILIFLISLLLGMENKKRMWALGLTFIISSAAVYFLFMTAWLNLFLFVGFIFWVRIAIAIVALFSGAYYLYDYATNPQGVCKVTGGEKNKKIFEKLRSIVGKRNFWMAFFGIIVLAFAVNLVELVCSAGLPAVFTQVLALSKLSLWQYYAYLALYIFVFMLDDIVVFSVAMLTLNTLGVSGKYSSLSRLIGGILMLIIGLLLAFKPSWLMF